jgi:hypothetical protein
MWGCLNHFSLRFDRSGTQKSKCSSVQRRIRQRKLHQMKSKQKEETRPSNYSRCRNAHLRHTQNSIGMLIKLVRSTRQSNWKEEHKGKHELIASIKGKDGSEKARHKLIETCTVYIIVDYNFHLNGICCILHPTKLQLDVHCINLIYPWLSWARYSKNAFT